MKRNNLIRPWLSHYDPDVPQALEYPDQPLYQFLTEAAKRYPNQTGIIWRETTITYRQLAEWVDLLAKGLIAEGLKPGERVGLLLPNIPQFVLLYYAILKAGGIVVALNPMHKNHELEYLLVKSGVRFLAGLASASEQLRELRQRTKVEKLILICLDDIPMLFPRIENPIAQKTSEQENEVKFFDLVSHGQEISLPHVSSEDPAIFQFSGGTTGTPKAAVGLHRNLVANTLQFRSWLSGMEDGREVTLAAIPLFHVYGMVIAMSLSVALGAKLVLVPNARDTQEILDALQRHKVTLYPGVPSMYHAINHAPEVIEGKFDLRSIKACISGSAPLHPEVKTAFERLTGGKLLEGYGLSEAPTATHCNPYRGENRTGSIGLPLPDVDCRLVDLSSGRRVVHAGLAGELIIRGPQVMRGYYQVEEAGEDVLQNGWLHTGDVARMDQDGYFYLIDRKKDLIKVSGFQVWPREIEEVLATHPAVLEAAAAGIPEPSKGEVVKAWVVLKPGASVEGAELQRWCAQFLTHYKIPAEIEFRSVLPRTSVGKVLRRQLVREHLDS